MDMIRARVAALAEQYGESLTSLSLMLGRNVAWLQQYLTRGTPRVLPEEERLKLAMHWHVDERELGARDPWTPAPVQSLRQ